MDIVAMIRLIGVILLGCESAGIAGKYAGVKNTPTLRVVLEGLIIAICTIIMVWSVCAE